MKIKEQYSEIYLKSVKKVPMSMVVMCSPMAAKAKWYGPSKSTFLRTLIIRILADGAYSPATEEAVTAFQKIFHLP